MRISHQYKVGNKILLVKPGINPKMSLPRRGPYMVLKVYTNGIVQIQRGTVSTRENIRRMRPFLDSPDPGGEWHILSLSYGQPHDWNNSEWSQD